MRGIEWAEIALQDMAALDRGIAQRIKRAVERFADTGASNVKRLQAINPPEYRLRVGDVSITTARRFAFCGFATAVKPIAEELPLSPCASAGAVLLRRGFR